MSGNVRFETTERVTATGLRQLVDERGIKHAWLARRIGVSRPHLSRVMNGRRTIAADKAAHVCELLGVPFSFAFESADASKDAA